MTKNYDSVEAILLSGSTISSIKGITSYKTKKRTRLSFLTVFVALFSFIFAQAQSTANYAFTTNTTGSLAFDANGNSVDMSSGTTQLVAADTDDASSPLTSIGFNFIMFGNTFTQFSATSNGIVQLGNTTPSTTLYVVSGGSTTSPRLGALAADLRTGTLGKVHYKVVGSAPNRTLVIEFLNMSLTYVATPGSNDGTYQVRLYETTGSIEYIYGSMFRNSSTTSNAAIYAGFSVGSLVNTTASITTATNTVSNGATFNLNSYTNSANIPNLHSTADGSRRIYSFTPLSVVLGDVTNLTFNTVTTNGMTLNWTDNATNEFGFTLTRATDAAFTQNVVNFNVTSTTSAGTGTDYTSVQTGLSSGTNYFYKVVANVEAGQSTGITGNQPTLNAATYYWTGLSGGTWDLFSNWNTSADGTGAIPTVWTPSDIHILDGAGTTPGGALSILIDRASFTVGQVKIINNTDLTLASNITTTRTITISGGPNEDFILETGSTLNLNSAANAVAFVFTGSGNTGTLAGTYVASGSTSNTINTTGGTGTLFTVAPTGNITSNLNSSSGCISGNVNSLLFQNGSNFTHSNSTTVNYIPTAIWQANATATLNGNTSGTTLTSGSTSLGNLIVNNTLSTGTLSAFTSNSRIIQGNLTVNSTGTGRFRAITSGILQINGNLIINGGIFEIGSTTGGGVIVKGTTSVASGGIIDLNQSTLQNEGNMINNGSVLSSETTTANSRLNFLGTSTAQTLSGSGTFTGRVSSLGVANPMGLTISTPVLVQRVNLFYGLVTGSSNITIGTGLALGAAVQVGQASNTNSGGNFDVSPIYNLGTGLYTILYLGETTPRTTGFEVPPTRTVNNLSLDNTNGLTISGGTIEVLNTLSLTNGVITSNLANHIIHGSTTTAGTLTGGSVNSYINGPIVRTINDANTPTNYVLYPIGKAGIYTPLWLAPTTTSSSKFRVESFDTNTGTSDASIIDLSSTRRWEAIPTSGTFTDINVRLGESTLVSTNIPVHATTANGAYNSAFGSVATFTTSTPNTIQSNFPVTSSNYTGYLSFANSNVCSGTPTPGNTITSSNSICLGESVTLSLQNITNGSGVTYQWKSSTDGITYTDISGATNPILNIVPTAVTYYLCDVTCTSGPTIGTSTAVQVAFTNNVIATTPATRCGTGTVTLDATPSLGATINWYANAVGGTALATGNSFTTPSISTTTDYYVEASTGSAINLGPISPTAQGGTTGTQTIAWNINFTVTQATQLISVDVFPITAGQTSAIALRNGSGTVISTVNFTTNVSGGTTPQTVLLNFPLTPGTYQLYPTLPSSGVTRNTSGAVYPYTSSVANITGNGFDATYFMGMYNWKFGSSCTSARTIVTATVSAPPTLTLSDSTKTICNGETSTAVTLTSIVSDYDTYVWTPNTGVSGDSTIGWSFNPTTTTSYTLNASQSSGSLCVSSTTLSVTVNPAPSAISFSPTAPTVCVDAIQALTANGGTINVNGSTPIGTATTLTTENNTDPTAFNNRYEHYWLQMVFTQAELNAAGVQAGNINGIKFNINSIGSATFVSDFKVNLGSTTQNTIAGFTPAGLTQVYSAATYNQTIGINSIVFNTPYIWDGTSNIIVDIRSTGADSANNSQTYYTATPDNKTVSAVTSTTFPSSDAYVATNPAGTLSLKRLNTTFDWSGNISTNNITWSPVTNLYSDATATVNYIAGTNATTVYYKSSSANTNTYTVTSTSSANCSSSADVTVTTLDCGIQYANLQFPGTATIDPCDTQVFYAQVYKAGVTEGAGQGAGITAWIGTNTSNTDPATWPESSWQLATFNVQVSNNDEYQATFGPLSAGIYYVASRFVFTPGNYVYGGYTPTGGGIWDGTTNVSATLTVNNVVAPTASAQSFCNSATVADLVATGTNLQWYTNLTGGTALASTTALASGDYYVSQTINSCESIRTMVSVTINVTSTPTASAQTFCNGATVADLVATGTALQWYITLTGGTALASTTTLVSGDYYVSQTLNSCESIRTMVTVTITTASTPTGNSLQTITENIATDATIEDIIVSGTGIVWYPTSVDAAAGTNPIAAGTQLVSGNTYYAVSVLGSCSSTALEVTVTVVLEVKSFDNKGLKYYPNPVLDMFTVSYSQNITSVEIYDLSGRKVKDNKANSSEVIIDMSELAASVYVVRVFAEGQSNEFKIVKK